METVKHFNNLSHVVPSLPAQQYFSPQFYESELETVWYKNWIYAGRSDEIADAGDFKSLRIGSQNILLVRDGDAQINGFFNTCRHRGSILCTEETGNLKSKHISCPYHRWTYALNGELVRTPHLQSTADFDRSQYSLYRVAVKQWGGCLFINLDAESSVDFDQTMDPSPKLLDNWPMQDLKVAHSFQSRIHCNWKIYWENFVECYHCPGIHPQLCELVPIYRRTHVSYKDEPNWQEHEHNPDPAYRGGLKSGAKTWTTDGELQGIQFEKLSEEELRCGYSYIQNLPSVFIVGHADYVRIVSILPDGPEHILLKSEWLLSEESLQQENFTLAKIVDFGMQVLQEDAAICERNQQGVKSIAHLQGVLMPQEYEVANFHRWLEEQASKS